MPMFIISMSWTDKAMRKVREAPKRAENGRKLAKTFGVEYKAIYMTSGDADLIVVVDTKHGDNVAKFVLALASRGNVRTHTARAWSEAEYHKMTAELP